MATNRFLQWQQSAILLIVCILSVVNIPLVISDDNLDNALFTALQEEDTERADALLKDGANINAISERGKQTPLMQK